MDKELLERLLSMFKIEAEERLSAMIVSLLELEKNPSEENRKILLENIFREAHSLKGAARAVNLSDVEALCQALENVFAVLKKNALLLSEKMFDTFHRVFDVIEYVLSKPGEVNISPWVEELEKLKTPGYLHQGEPHYIKVSQPFHDAGKETFSEIFNKFTVNKEEDNILYKDSDYKDDNMDSSHKVIPDGNIAEKTIPMEDMEEVKKETEDIKKLPVVIRDKTGDTVRISISKLDALFLKSEELLAVKLSEKERTRELKSLMEMILLWKKQLSRASSAGSFLQKSFGKIKENNTIGKYEKQLAILLEFLDINANNIKNMEHQISLLAKSSENDYRSFGLMVDNLIDDMKNTIILPFSSLLGAFPRMVRDISRSQAKEVELTIRDCDIEIDKRILEEIKTPLIHILRNSIDHGIEKPDERVKLNKPVCGNITISLNRCESNKFEIVISDDGSGINIKKLKEVSLQKNIISEEELLNLSEEDVISLVFQSDISTSPIITDISGRGLGLAIVKETVEKLGGAVKIKNKPNKGIDFIVILPLSLSTFRGTTVSSGGYEFIIPTVNIEKILRVKKEDLKTVENKRVIYYKDEVIPLFNLSEVMELSPEKNNNEKKYFPIVIIISGEKYTAFMVDEIVNEEEVLVKSLGKQLSRVRNILGATIIGSGKIVPVINITDLIKSSLNFKSPSVYGKDAGTSGERNNNILVVEDSITSRMLLKNILEAAGYNVKTTIDGLEAFTALKEEDFDLVISDVEMPRMNGFELTSKIRRDNKLAKLPVILVTGLSSREDREKGIDAGANAYIVKSTFDQSNLLGAIKKLI